MKRRFLREIWSIVVFMILVTFALSFAAEGEKIRVQGKVMELDLKQMVIVVNEKTFSLDQKTVLSDEKGSPIPLDRLKVKAQVYIVGAIDQAHQRLVAQRIYLLSKRITNKEKHLYLFMQDTPPED